MAVTLLSVINGCAPSQVASSTPSETPKQTPLTIGAIIASPRTYEGQSITITAEYRGWESGYGSPPVTKSDWIIQDSTGAIYVTGQAPGNLDPMTGRGAQVIVTGTVRVLDGKPYIELTTKR